MVNIFTLYILGDSPLTEIGKFQAKLTGEALGNEGFKIHYCYASPALRCIQTAHQVLQGILTLSFKYLKKYFKETKFNA